jgi:hypothetical protein
MNDDTFARLVAEEVKNRVTPSQVEYLRLPENWTRWQRALMALNSNLDAQLDALARDHAEDQEKYAVLGQDGLAPLAESLADIEARQKKITRFQFHVSSRLDEVTKMIALGAEGVDQRLAAVEFLRKAIERHRSIMEELDLEPTAVDVALWAALDGKWEFDSLNYDDLYVA